MPTYNELTDYQVQTMNKSEAPFDTQAYSNYKELVNNEKEQIDPNNLTEYIYKLGFKIDTLLSKIIAQLDTIIESESEEENDKKIDWLCVLCYHWNGGNFNLK